MKFKISQELDSISNLKAPLIERISNKLELFLINKNYGNDIETFYIGFIAVNTKNGLKKLFKERKPKYIRYKEIKSRLTGEIIIVSKEYSFDIKFDDKLYDDFVNTTNELSEKIFITKLIESFKNLDKLPKEIIDFDIKKFKQDVFLLLNTP